MKGLLVIVLFACSSCAIIKSLQYSSEELSLHKDSDYILDFATENQKCHGQKNASSCLLVGEYARYHTLNNAGQTEAVANEALKKGCQLNDSKSCNYYYQRTNDLLILKDFCSQKIPSACNTVYRKTGDVSFAEKSCLLNDSYGCYEQALSLDYSSQLQDIRKLLTKSCTSGFKDACSKLWDLRSNAPELQKEYEGYCISKTVPVACFYASSLYFEDQAPSFNKKKGLDLLEKGCTLQDLSSCDRALDIYKRDEDYSKISKLCDFSHGDSCYEMAVSLRDKPNTASERKRYYKQACNFKHGEACEKLQHIDLFIYRDSCDYDNDSESCQKAGSKLVEDRDSEGEGLSYFRKGCRLGNRFSCQEYEVTRDFIIQRNHNEAVLAGEILKIGQQFNQAVSAPYSQPQSQTYTPYSSSNESSVYSNNSNTRSYSNSCGIKPIPQIGYKIGRCVDGQWEQVSVSPRGTMECGFKPIPQIGYEIGRCVNGQWEQVSKSPRGTMECGFKPIPKIGCKVARCVNGHWEQVCK